MSTYSTNLKVQLIGTGEESGTWGDVTNNAFSNVFEQAIVGYGTVNFSSDANTTLTLANGNTSQTARNLYLNVTSSGSLTATRDVIIPSITSGSTPIQKLYIVKNATTGSQSIRIIGASGTGTTIPNGVTAMVYSNGTNVVDVATYFSSLRSGTIQLLGSSTGYSTFASANSSATNYTVTFPAESMSVGFRNIPNTGTKTSSYTLAVSDVGKYVQVGASGAIVVPNSTFADGDVVSVINTNSTSITITCNTTTANISGVTTAKGGGGTVTLLAKGVASVIFISSTACIISGAVT
jgi:hypothetical protein